MTRPLLFSDRAARTVSLGVGVLRDPVDEFFGRPARDLPSAEARYGSAETSEYRLPCGTYAV